MVSQIDLLFLFIYFVQSFCQRVIVVGTVDQRHVSSNQRQVAVPFLDYRVLDWEVMIGVHFKHFCLLRLKALDLQVCIAKGV
jgi:hypothetical protein